MPEHPSLQYKALFPADTFVDVTEESLDQAFLTDADTPHRRRLVSQLRLFIAYLKSLGLSSFEMWINGSFSTVNPDPMDVDVVCFLPHDQLMAITDEHWAVLAGLASREGRAHIREKWSVDYYHCSFNSLEDRNYWKDIYSKDEYGTRKGIGRIKL